MQGPRKPTVASCVRTALRVHEAPSGHKAGSDDADTDSDELPIAEQLADVLELTDVEHERCVDSTVTHRRL